MSTFLPSSCLRSVMPGALREGEIEDVVGTHLEDGHERHAGLEVERVNARRGVGHVGLIGINQLALARGRARLDLGLDVGEVAQLLGDPVGIVVEHVERAAWGNPSDLARLAGEDREFDPVQRREREAERGRALHDGTTVGLRAGQIGDDFIETTHTSCSSVHCALRCAVTI